MKSKRAIIIIGIVFLLAVLVVSSLGCQPADNWRDPVYLRDLTLSNDMRIEGGLAVGDIDPPAQIELPPGGGSFNSTVRARTLPKGTGLVSLPYDALTPDHIGIGSFDLTGSTFNNQFTSTVSVFTAEDANLSNWIVITSEPYTGWTAEIEVYIDGSNVALETFDWDVDLTNQEFVIVRHPEFATADGGHVTIDAAQNGNFIIHSYQYTNGDLVVFDLDAAADGTHNTVLFTDANGNEGVAGLGIPYITGDMQPGDIAHVLGVALIDNEAVSSDSTTEINVIEVLTTDGSDMQKHALHIGQGFDKAITVAGGVAADPGYGYTVVPDSPVDRVNGAPGAGTAFLEASASNVQMFAANGDYILIGADTTFEGIQAILTIEANVSITPSFSYSTGNGTWSTLSVTDATSGFTESGTITFVAPGDWATSNLTTGGGSALSSAYYVRVTRNRIALGTPPTEDYFITYSSSSVSDFEVRGDGTLIPVHMADASAPNDSLYYSTDQSKLVYKDHSGTVNGLY
jgi:hypothetical protein